MVGLWALLQRQFYKKLERSAPTHLGKRLLSDKLIKSVSIDHKIGIVFYIKLIGAETQLCFVIVNVFR